MEGKRYAMAVTATVLAALVVGGVELSRRGVAATESAPAPATSPATASATATAPAAEALAREKARDIRRMLVRLVNNAYTPGEFDEVVGYLAKEDRDRLAEFAAEDQTAFDQRVEAFRKAFKDRYGRDFEVQEEHFEHLDLQMGKDDSHATLATGQRMKGAATAPATGKADRAGVVLALVNEGNVLNAWRIDVTNTLEGAALREALETQITSMADGQAWPKEADAALRRAAEGVLEALGTSPLAVDKP